MAGNINNISFFISLAFLVCFQQSCENKSENVYIRIANETISYNKDTIKYYIVNKSKDDIKIFCNPSFFNRQKDSLITDTWFNPQLIISDQNNIINPVLLNVHFKKKILDSLSSIKDKYHEVESLVNLRNDDFKILRKYILTIKKNDSLLLKTKINFENEPRFYDWSETEGYILNKNSSYKLMVHLNRNLSHSVKEYLKENKMYNEEISSNPVKIKVIQTDYYE